MKTRTEVYSVGKSEASLKIHAVIKFIIKRRFEAVEKVRWLLELNSLKTVDWRIFWHGVVTFLNFKI